MVNVSRLTFIHYAAGSSRSQLHSSIITVIIRFFSIKLPLIWHLCIHSLTLLPSVAHEWGKGARTNVWMWDRNTLDLYSVNFSVFSLGISPTWLFCELFYYNPHCLLCPKCYSATFFVQSRPTHFSKVSIDPYVTVVFATPQNHDVFSERHLTAQ